MTNDGDIGELQRVWNIFALRTLSMCKPLPSSRRRRLLICGNSGERAIERDGPVD
jgi:hypothetical protein